MRHLKSGRRLNRSSSHRLALYRNQAKALLEHGRITTTVPKAKELRGFVEHLITVSKKRNPGFSPPGAQGSARP